MREVDHDRMIERQWAPDVKRRKHDFGPHVISRRPGKEATRGALVNRTSRGGTDAVLFAAQPLTDRWSGTLLVGGHWQQRSDVDDDGPVTTFVVKRATACRVTEPQP